jgi:hypothetical protein
LVNKLIESLKKVSQRVTILRGNHDAINPDSPYFEFLNEIPDLRFISKPTFTDDLADCLILHIPHGTDLKKLKISHRPDLVLMHITVRGAIDFTGRELPGEDFELGYKTTILSGDVHRAQKVGTVEYIGVPYDTRHGEHSTRSAILFKDGERFDLKFPAPRKRTFRIRTAQDLDRIKGKSGDFIRVVIELPPEKVDQANETRSKVDQMVARYGFILDGVQLQLQIDQADVTQQQLLQPDDAFDEFCRQHKLTDFLIDVGRSCLGVNPLDKNRRSGLSSANEQKR